MRLHMTFFHAMSSAVHSQLDTPEKQNAHQPLCTRPKETPLKELVEAKVDDKYPITDVDNAIRKLDRDTKDSLQTARSYTNSLCYRYNPFQPRFNESLAGRPFEFFPIATDTEIEPRPTWSPSCSSSSKSFYFPRTVTHDGQTCWMELPNILLILVTCVVSVQSNTYHPPPRHLIPRVPPPHLLPPHPQPVPPRHPLPPHLQKLAPPHLLPPHLQHLLPPHLQPVPPHHPLPPHLQLLPPHKPLPSHLQPLPPHHPLPPHLQPLPPHQVLPPPQPVKPPQPAGRCVPPRDETVTKLIDAKLVGKYPAADISRYLRKSSRHFNRHVAQARRTASCHCNRHKAKSSHSSYGAPPPPPKHTSTQWVDTCPAVQNLFFFPKSTEFHGHHCWILRPWVRQSGGCPYVGCQQRSCLGVTAVSEHVFPGIKACRHTNFKTMVYYIWCPKLGQLIRQYKRLPQCCSCMVLRC